MIKKIMKKASIFHLAYSRYILGGQHDARYRLSLRLGNLMIIPEMRHCEFPDIIGSSVVGRSFHLLGFLADMSSGHNTGYYL